MLASFHYMCVFKGGCLDKAWVSCLTASCLASADCAKADLPPPVVKVQVTFSRQHGNSNLNFKAFQGAALALALVKKMGLAVKSPSTSIKPARASRA